MKSMMLVPVEESTVFDKLFNSCILDFLREVVGAVFSFRVIYHVGHKSSVMRRMVALSDGSSD